MTNVRAENRRPAFSSSGGFPFVAKTKTSQEHAVGSLTEKSKVRLGHGLVCKDLFSWNLQGSKQWGLRLGSAHGIAFVNLRSLSSNYAHGTDSRVFSCPLTIAGC